MSENENPLNNLEEVGLTNNMVETSGTGIAPPSEIAEAAFDEVQSDVVDPPTASSVVLAETQSPDTGNTEAPSIKKSDMPIPAIPTDLDKLKKEVKGQSNNKSSDVIPSIVSNPTEPPSIVSNSTQLPSIVSNPTEPPSIVSKPIELPSTSTVTSNTQIITEKTERIELQPSTVINLTVQNVIPEKNDEGKVIQRPLILPTEKEKAQSNIIKSQDNLESSDLFSLKHQVEELEKNQSFELLSPSRTVMIVAGEVDEIQETLEAIKNTGQRLPSQIGEYNKEINLSDPEKDITTSIHNPISKIAELLNTSIKESNANINSPSTFSLASTTSEQVEPEATAKVIKSELITPTEKEREQSFSDVYTPSSIIKEVNIPMSQKKDEREEPSTNQSTPSTVIQLQVNASKKSDENEESSNTTQANQVEVKSSNPSTGETQNPTVKDEPIRVESKSQKLTPDTIKNIMTSSETKGLAAVTESLAGVRTALEEVKTGQVTNNQTSTQISNSNSLVTNVEAGKSIQLNKPQESEKSKEEVQTADVTNGDSMVEFYLHAIYDALVSQGIKIKSYS